jgi:erythronate-4-phosphate dehydrogenase
VRLLVDENLRGAETLYEPLGELVFRPGRAIGPADVAAADALMLRSQTRVDAALLGDARPCFVGTGTAGTEHVDAALLDRIGIPFASAPGCNAGSVADWVLAALARAVLDGALPASGTRAAVIGAGAVGGRVVRRLRALGFDVVVCDPPLERAGGEAGAPFVDLDEALAAPVVTLHVPRVDAGPDATRGLVDAVRIEALAPGTVLLNAARGGVVDDAALARRLARADDLWVALDVFAAEPVVDPGLADACRIATPHVAGHSIDGKTRGTAMIGEALCAVLDVPVPVPLAAALPAPAAPVAVTGTGLDVWAWLAGHLDLVAETAALRGALASDPRGAFDRLRRAHPSRRDFTETAVAAGGEAARTCAAMGFVVTAPGPGAAD